MPRSWWYLISQFWGDQVHPATPFCVSSFLRKINSLQQWIIKSDLGHPPRQEVRKASNNLPLDVKCAKDTQDREVFARNEDFYPRPEDPASRGGPRYTHRVDLYSIQVSLVERNKSPSDLERVLWDKTVSFVFSFTLTVGVILFMPSIRSGYPDVIHYENVGMVTCHTIGEDHVLLYLGRSHAASDDQFLFFISSFSVSFLYLLLTPKVRARSDVHLSHGGCVSETTIIMQTVIIQLKHQRDN